MKTLKIFTIAAFAAISASCSSDFLESTPILSVVEDQYYQSDEDMYGALIGAYDPLAYYFNMANYITVSEIISDNGTTGAGNDADQPYLQDLEAFNVDSDTNLTSYYFWKFHYRGIFRCNQVINAEYESDVADVYKAEAKVLRAWYHFELMRLYGPCVVSTTNDWGNDYPFVRNTRGEVNAQIEKDLTEAIPYLQESFDSSQTGRIRKSAAQALMGKHLMYKADWLDDDQTIFKEAITYLEAAANSGQYTLAPYDQMFHWTYRNTTESIFEVQSTNSQGSTTTGTPDYIYNNEGNYWIKWINPRFMTGHYLYINSCWGCWHVTKSLYDHFLPDDTFRRDVAIAVESDFNGVVNPDTGAVSSYDPSSFNQNDWEGYDKKKYLGLVSEIPTSGNGNHNYATNIILIRLTDVYLYLAEAYIRTGGSETTAKSYLTKVRDAHVPDGLSVDALMSTYPERFPSLLDVVWYERRAEFACEGDRWYDLVRRGIAEETMVNHAANERLTPFTINWKNTMNYLPLHLEERTLCPTLTEYPDEAYDTSLIYQ